MITIKETQEFHAMLEREIGSELCERVYEMFLNVFKVEEKRKRKYESTKMSVQRKAEAFGEPDYEHQKRYYERHKVELNRKRAERYRLKKQQTVCVQ